MTSAGLEFADCGFEISSIIRESLDSYFILGLSLKGYHTK